MSIWLQLALVLLTARWWWAVGATLLEDLDAASFEAPPELPRETAAARTIGGLVAGASRTPLGRRLAFRGVARRVAARRRWEAGFGRRGL